MSTQATSGRLRISFGGNNGLGSRVAAACHLAILPCRPRPLAAPLFAIIVLYRARALLLSDARDEAHTRPSVPCVGLPT